MSERKTIAETLHNGVSIVFDVDDVLYQDGTGHHQLALIRNGIFGKVLMLDGAVQVTSRDEFMYHEMLAHVPIAAHDNPADVLIIGGGDCGLAEEVLKHKRVGTLTQVEIDASVLEFSKEHFADFNASVFDDPRFKVEIADGAAFAAETDQRFDVILVDSTDPSGPGAVLFTTEFYRNLKRILRPGGIVVSQNGVPFLQPEEFQTAMRGLRSVFEIASCYLVAVPTYFGGHMTLGWSTDNADTLKVSEETLAQRMAGIDTRYYTPAHHRASFALPRFIETLLEEATK
ncbi:polyamine aminopropyltransferase [Nitratireductor aquimarinus]|uniref:polyamine aminopropyltransferase n=1 Tax=Alphaproteobacteria TaxID=28211 RepID=UPI0019D32F03|nr:polyamine aminopropyltransferase [Tritonibacter mobilis]MBN7756344.1 polyamine aminopropyltransferase [Nitratireductor aquimarinus]MBY6021130.1 polyamine aminopropyltransferase [Nitratireductor sp. DP7N14-4]